ncbi:DUF423 domain-containing protein [Stappia sp.]|uniref:DUF423 domain-containing protein n=1 Tax=Stappia sp. TaxID=1870903 RepID=UPI0032D99314
MLLLAGLAGAAGVALAAGASHAAAGALLEPASRMLLVHAPLYLFLAFALRWRPRSIFAGIGLVLTLGLLLFCGDLLARAFAGTRLFPFAAPLGGSLLILTWVGVAAAGLAWFRKTRDG